VATPESQIGRLPPQSLEAERSVLGAMLIESEAIPRALTLLVPEDFYRDAHRAIYEAMLLLFERSEPVDLVTLSSELGKQGRLEAVGGAAYLTQLASGVPTAAHVERYAQMVRDRSLARQVIRAGTDIVARGFDPQIAADELLDEAEQRIFQIAQSRSTRSYSPLKDVLIEAIAKVDTVYREGGGVTGVRTGFGEFDDLTAGLQPADLIIIAARPSMGKTAFALNVARNAAMAGVPSAIFSLEMSREQLALRLVCAEGFINQNNLRTGKMSEADWKNFAIAVDRLSAAQILIDDAPGLTALDLRARARRMKAEHHIGLILIDYLQLMEARGRHENRQQEISAISRSLKALARELSVPVVALSQLSRAVESRQDKQPMLSDLRESGAIEQDADIVAFIYREDYYNADLPPEQLNTAQINIAKQRNGPTGRVTLHFHKEFGRFDGFDRQEAR
jgi:replicative DNA helicase